MHNQVHNPSHTGLFPEQQSTQRHACGTLQGFSAKGDMVTSYSAPSSLAAATLLFMAASSNGLTGEGRPEPGWMLAPGSALSP